MNINKFLYRLLIVFLIAMLLVSGGFVAKYVIEAYQQKNAYDSLAAQVEQIRASAAETATPPAEVHPLPEAESNTAASAATEPDEVVPTEPVMLPEYAALYAENSDLVGWMVIDGTPINYPVMQTPDRPDYYLKRNFEQQQNEHGCLYVRESCDVFAPSDNVTIYGHHMKDGSMFSSLKKFRKQEFWEEYHTIDFDTLYERHSYTIFSVFTTSAYKGEGFSYHLFEVAADEAEFDEFVATCKNLSLYDTGITPKYGDKLICLSTCEYSQAQGRLVVVAMRN